jgi:hypothetical protein
LWLNESFQVILQNLGEVVLQLRTTEVGQNFLPVWGILGKNNEIEIVANKN